MDGLANIEILNDFQSKIHILVNIKMLFKNGHFGRNLRN